MTTDRSNMEYWRQYGDCVLMAMPYADQVLVEGCGCTLRDADGKELLDLAAGMFCCVLGHNHPKFVERVVKQATQLVHTGTQYLSPIVMEASYKLAQVTPGALQKSILLSTGTEANEFAFRLAKAYTGRTGILGLSRGYYGTSLATKSCSGLFSHRLKDSLPLAPESFRLPITAECVTCFTAGDQDCGFPCLETAENWIGDWGNVAAVIVEPFLSAGGMLLPPAGYLKRLRQMAHDRGALFIVDEAQTGFGRTGTWFAIEHHDAQPDILSLSKSVGNGFPVAAVITTAEIADQVISDGLWNLSSHQSDPVGAAAMAAVIDIVREEHLMDQARDTGAYFMNGLRELAARHRAIKRVRGQGLMIGFDLVPDDPALAAEAPSRFMYGCRHRGLHLTYGYGDIHFRVIPPLVITRAEIDFAIDVMDQALGHLLSNKDNADDLWPANPHARRLFKQSRWRRVVDYMWRSSAEELVEKAGSKIREKLGVG